MDSCIELAPPPDATHVYQTRERDRWAKTRPRQLDRPNDLVVFLWRLDGSGWGATQHTLPKRFLRQLEPA